MGPNTLHVRPVTADQIAKEWGFSFPDKSGAQLYAKCTVNGKITWNTTHIYGQKEIELKPKVKILFKESLSTNEVLAKIVSLSGNIKGIYKAVYNTATDKKQFAFDVAQQANTDKLTKKGMENTVGTEIVSLCLELYPNVKLGDKYSKRVKIKTKN